MAAFSASDLVFFCLGDSKLYVFLDPVFDRLVTTTDSIPDAYQGAFFSLHIVSSGVIMVIDGWGGG